MPIPEGFYAVPDPDQPERVTYWAVDRTGTVRDYPRGVRWRPSPPPIEPWEKHDRTAIRRAWYDQVYFPWRAVVAEAIEADLDGTAARFLERYPEPAAELVPGEKPPRVRRPPLLSPVRDKRAPALRAAQAMLAHSLRELGTSFEGIASALGISEPTARRRVATGEIIAAADALHRDPTGQRKSVDPFTDTLARLLDRFPRRGEPIPDVIQQAATQLLKPPEGRG